MIWLRGWRLILKRYFFITFDVLSVLWLSARINIVRSPLVALILMAEIVFFLNVAPLFAAQDPSLPSSKPTVIRGVEVSKPVMPSVFEGDLRDLSRAFEAQPGEPVKEMPKITYPRGRSKRHIKGKPTVVTQGLDPLPDLRDKADVNLSSPALRTFSAPELNFSGQGYSLVQLPDPVGDVDPNYYIQMLNGNPSSI